MKKIAILGSTGSIGIQALDIIKQNEDRFQVVALTCGRQVDLLVQQIAVFHPKVVCVQNEKDAIDLKNKISNHVEILFGDAGLIEIAGSADWDLLLNALVGIIGLAPTISAIRKGKQIALANKETVVAGGKLVMDAVRKTGVSFLPVDSEHSAIFQALQGNSQNQIQRIILTASGGPFRGYSLDQLRAVTIEQALKHPKWTMGSKITIDSATMMNKGLEVIEARWLFDVMPESIQVLVHKESIIHSMVEYQDSSIIAQLGMPDMKVPISYAFTYPERIETKVPSLDLFQLGSLTFEPVDTQVFRCLSMAYESIKAGQSYVVAMNAANEVLVRQFLDRKIAFVEIQNQIERVLEEHQPVSLPTVSDIIELDHEVRRKLERWD